jgi:hypothetical protein
MIIYSYNIIQEIMDIQILKNYSHQGLCRAIEIFRFSGDYPNRIRLLGYRFLLQYGYLDTRLSPNKQTIISQMKEMIDKYYTVDTTEATSILMELVDMLIDFSPEDGKQLLAYLREKRKTANDASPSMDGAECTVYADSQSAHNADISDSTRRAAKYLVEMYPLLVAPENKNNYYDNIKAMLISECEKDCKNIDVIIDRIYSDNATFGIDVTVDQVLMSLLIWINEQVKEGKFARVDIFKRLTEEFNDMENYCSSGLLSRIINCMQGFTDDIRLAIRISDREQIKSVVYTHLNKEIQACQDDVIIDGLVDKNIKFLNFVRKCINAKTDDWVEEYSEETMSKYIKEIFNEYVGTRTYA